MKNTFFTFLSLSLLIPLSGNARIAKTPLSKSEVQMNKFVSSLMSRMTLEEKIGQTVLCTGRGDVTGPVAEADFVQQAKNGNVGSLFNVLSMDKIRQAQEEVVRHARLHIPLMFGYDVIHGYHTTFPIPLAMASSWDMNLIELATSSMAEEAAADGLNWAFAPMVDICRDPRWGRIAEGAGEDAFLGSAVARAQVKGIQGSDLSSPQTLLACVKHFAAYGGATAGRDYNSVDMSERHLREFYLPPYQAAVEAGCGSIMTSFNDINGIPSTGNHWLLTDLLRNEWGFKGVVVTDYSSLYELINHGVAKDSADAGIIALKAGVDLDMQGNVYKNFSKLNYQNKAIREKEIDQACRRVLEAKYQLGLFDDPYRYCDAQRAKALIENPKYAQRAREVARSSIVLLKNEHQVLPIAPDCASIALIGPFVKDQGNQLGMWCTAGRRELVETIEQAFRTKYPHTQFHIAEGCSFKSNMSEKIDTTQFAQARQAARESAVVILCLGEKRSESGEAASKTDLHLSATQRALIREIKKVGKPMVLLLHGGRPQIISEEEPLLDAMLQVWHLGCAAGPAIADVVSGDYNPSGKMTVTYPRNMGQIPIYYNELPTGRPSGEAHFTSRYIDAPFRPLYPFGYGLSYTTFHYSPVTLSCTQLKRGAHLTASVQVTNTGKRDGDEVIQLYIHDKVASLSRPMKELKGFRKVHIPAGKTVKVDFEISEQELSFYNTQLVRQAEAGDFELFIGPNSDTENKAVFTLL